MSLKLYETYYELEAVWRRAEMVLTGEMTAGPDGIPISEADALGWIEGVLSRIGGDGERKALNLAAIVKNYRAEAAALEAEATRLLQRQAAAEKTARLIEAHIARIVPEGGELRDSRSVIAWQKTPSGTPAFTIR